MKHLIFPTLLAVAICSISTLADAQWVYTNGPSVPPGSSGSYVNCFAVSGTKLFAGTYGGVFLSTDSGASWTAVNIGLVGDTVVSALVASGTELWAGTLDGVFHSTNYGTIWAGPLTPGPVFALAIFGSNVYDGGPGGVGVGTTSAFVDGPIRAFAVMGDTLVAGGDSGVYLAPHGNFANVPVGGLGDTNVYALAVIGTNLFAGTLNNGVILSTDYDTSWTATSHPSTFVDAFAVSGTNLFAGNDVDGVYLSTNNGTSWTRVSPGLTYPHVHALAVSGTNLFAGTSGFGVWRRPLSQMITSVEETGSHERPKSYSLQQNYPNPFNPTTSIEFSIPQSGFVTVQVFNTLGEVVGTLVSEELHSGNYTTSWEASGFSSGVYFYRLQTGSFSETRKLILLR